MNRSRSISVSTDSRLEHLLAFVLVLTVLIGTYAGCILLARLLLALGWYAS